MLCNRSRGQSKKHLKDWNYIKLCVRGYDMEHNPISMRLYICVPSVEGRINITALTTQLSATPETWLGPKIKNMSHDHDHATF